MIYILISLLKTNNMKYLYITNYYVTKGQSLKEIVSIYGSIHQSNTLTDILYVITNNEKKLVKIEKSTSKGYRCKVYSKTLQFKQ